MKYRTSRNYILRNIGGRDVLVSVGANVVSFNGYIELNPSAAFIYKKIQEESAEEEIAKALAEEFGITYDTALSDVREFAGELIEEKIITVTE